MPIIVNDLMDDWIVWLINECYHWIVPSRYANLSPLGHGSFGLVWLDFIYINKTH